MKNKSSTKERLRRMPIEQVRAIAAATSTASPDEREEARREVCRRRANRRNRIGVIGLTLESIRRRREADAALTSRHEWPEDVASALKALDQAHAAVEEHLRRLQEQGWTPPGTVRRQRDYGFLPGDRVDLRPEFARLMGATLGSGPFEVVSIEGSHAVCRVDGGEQRIPAEALVVRDVTA